MMTAPSTIRPKSSAPRLIRLAEILACDHAGHGQQHGHRDDERGDDRRAEIAQQQEQDEDDEAGAFGAGSWRRCAPSPRPGWVRSRTVCTTTPGGSELAGSRSMRASTAAATVRLFSPISIRAVPTTTSRPSSLAGAGAQSRFPMRTSATSLIRTGTPPRVVDDHARRSRPCFPGGRRRGRRSLRRCPRGSGRPGWRCWSSRARTTSPNDRSRAVELRRVRLDVVLLLEAADAVDAGDPRDRLDLWADDPVLDRAQVGGLLQFRPEALTFRRQVAAVRLPTGLPAAETWRSPGLA
jgi:hypothetical protein